MNAIVRSLIAACALGLAGCAPQIVKVDSGAHQVGQRLVVDIDGAWNKLDPTRTSPAQVWSMEGFFVDTLSLFSDVKDGNIMHRKSPESAKVKDVAFHAGMQPEELVSMFEALYSRDQSVVTVTKSEPYPFAGRPGVRFEFERIRKSDNVRLLGVGFASIDNGLLYAMVYQAPRLAFFPRHKDRVEAIARSAQIRG